ELSDRELEGSSGLNLINKKVRHRLIGTADIFIAISDEIENSLKKYTSKDSEIIRIPNGVDTEKYYPPSNNHKKQKIRKYLNIPQNETVLLYVVAINNRKGVHDLLDALCMLDTNEKVRCILCVPILEDINFYERIKEINKKENI